MRSESIAKLAEALAKAQHMMEYAKKDSMNPHFKNKYADIAAVIEAIRDPLAVNGLSYVQYQENRDGVRFLVTELMHTSGEWIRGDIELLFSKNDMQGLGSALTYARRYSLSAMVGIAQDDDDGNAASSKEKKGDDSVTPKQLQEWMFGKQHSDHIVAILKSIGQSIEFANNLSSEKFKKGIRELNEGEYKTFINILNAEGRMK